MTFGNALTLGLLIGAVLGALTGSWRGFVLCTIAGGVAAALMRSKAKDPATPAAASAPPGGNELAALERRIARVEALLESIVARGGAVQPGTARATSPTAAAPSPNENAAPAAREPAPPPVAPAPPPAYTVSQPERAAQTASMQFPWDARFRKWVAEGNLLARAGVVVLFFGVAFLLRYFAQRFTIPIEARLAGVALIGAVLVLIGARLARRRPAYGLTLEGAGCGVLYLTTFAAFRLFGVLPSGAAFVLLAIVAALTVWLAMRHDSQALAGLAIAGGFMAPVLVGGGGSPVPLFGWFAGLNAAIFALAWRRSGRALNVLGFIFTFVLGLAWGYRFYRPEHFAVVEPFLALFFAFYVGIAVLYAGRGPMSAKAPVDALLVFGVPLVGFLLQFALVRDTRYGAAWSAVVLAAIYASLFVALRARAEAGVALLARAFGLLAIVFVTVAIPNALDARWTSAWWAVEGACAYWIGCRQGQPAVRAFAIALQLVAACWFVAAGSEPRDVAPFVNATFTGAVMIALSAWATAWLAEHGPGVARGERIVAPWALAFGLLCWMVGVGRELERGYAPDELPAAALAWSAGTALVALVAHGWWTRLLWLAAPVLPVLIVAGVVALRNEHTTLLHGGWLAWPLAFVAQWWLMKAAERAIATRPDKARAIGALADDVLHAVSTIVLVGWLCWEASEWVGRYTAPTTVWLACAAAVPAIAALFVIRGLASAQRWPLTTHHEAYRRQAGLLIATGLLGWVVVTDVLSPGDPAPLPYVPVLNPLDVTSLAALFVLALWSRDAMRLDARSRYAALAAAGFVVLNGGVLRAAHHWGGLAWNLRELLASRPLQAALTLTWTVTALALMIGATRARVRAWWVVGAALLVVVVAKLFLIDLATLSDLPKVVAFLGVGALMLVIGYFAPLPPGAANERT